MRHITSSREQRFSERQEFEYQGERKREGKIERIWRHHCVVQGLVLLSDEQMNLGKGRRNQGCLMCEHRPSAAAIKLSHS